MQHSGRQLRSQSKVHSKVCTAFLMLSSTGPHPATDQCFIRLREEVVCWTIEAIRIQWLDRGVEEGNPGTEGVGNPCLKLNVE